MCADHPHSHEEALCSADSRRETYVKQPRTVYSRRADAAAMSIPIVSVQAAGAAEQAGAAAVVGEISAVHEESTNAADDAACIACTLVR